jgi:hypothetical protein
MLKAIKIVDIVVGSRHRKDMGDLTILADSIRQEGLLQSIGVTDRLELVFGERRLLAYRDILKRKRHWPMASAKRQMRWLGHPHGQAPPPLRPPGSEGEGVEGCSGQDSLTPLRSTPRPRLLSSRAVLDKRVRAGYAAR